ncbi:MAG: ribosome biogenesis factor YjgA [Moraxellaceae bacterium]
MPRHSVHDDLEDFEDYGPSKTEQKKAMERLQALGERLAGLPASQLKKLPLSERLQAALDELARLKSHEAVRRQKQFIGKLMRDENEEAILAALNPLANPALNRQMDVLLERLLQQGDAAINDTVRRFAAAERHTLRQYVRSALKEQLTLSELPAEQQATADTPARHKLLTYLREIVALDPS